MRGAQVMVSKRAAGEAPNSWDVVAEKYFDSQREKIHHPNKSSTPSTEKIEDDSKNAVYHRLYQDYFNRVEKQKQTREDSNVQREEQRKKDVKPRFGRRAVHVRADHVRHLHDQIQREHLALRTATEEVRRLERERQRYLRNPPPLSFSPTSLQVPDEYIEIIQSLMDIGDPQTNLSAIGVLIKNNTLREVEHFYEKCTSLKATQDEIVGNLVNRDVYEAAVEDQLTVFMMTKFGEAVADVLRNEELEFLNDPSPEPPVDEDYIQPRKWMREGNIKNDVAKQAKKLLEDRGIMEDVTGYRREHFAEFNLYLLRVIKELLEIELEMRRFWGQYRIDKFLMWDFDLAAADTVRKSDPHFMGTSTSLKSNLKINQSVRKILNDTLAIFLEEQPLPQLADPERAHALEVVLGPEDPVEQDVIDDGAESLLQV